MTFPFWAAEGERSQGGQYFSPVSELALALIRKFSLYSHLGFGNASCRLCDESVQGLQGGEGSVEGI